jgi:hypothetical protein
VQTAPLRLKGAPLGVPKESGPQALPLCRRPEQSPKGEATENIAFAVACFFLLRFPPKNRLSSPKSN